ncbi:MAG: helix-turn-helix domain-containing protein [Oscillospiraceae bacterium]|jgi:transcriptional regulator with XRE-family HTH domain|nr:helix-turn-helix domain-containing protein [Oscillospiraceae bacterium]
MDTKIIDIAERIKGLRDDCGYTVEEMAEAANVTLEEYRKYESGVIDFPYSFLHRCAEKYGVDVVELLTGESPHLLGYAIIRNGKGLQMSRREGFQYFHLAPLFRNKLAEPFRVIAPFKEEDQTKPIELNTHEGQEFDFILSGKMRFVFEKHEEVLEAGDSVFYDSGRSHGMIAIEGKPCEFLAVVIKPKEA